MIALHIDRKFTRGRALTSERYAAHNRSVTDTNTLASGNQIVTAHFGWANWLGKRKNIPHGLSAAITVVQAIENHKSGGEGGIRTPGTLSGTPVFKTGAINHSATSPANADLPKEPADAWLVYNT